MSSKSRPSDRNLGIVYTPPEIANAIVDEVIAQSAASVAAVLEPSVGDGSFLDALNRVGILDRVTALDVDDRAVERVRARLAGACVKVGEFLAYAASTDSRFDLIIGNPPYIRRKNFSDDIKAEIEALARRQGYPRADLKNAWSAFVVASEALLKDDGKLAFVVPYELMNVDYGIAIQRWLAERFARLDIYIPDEKAFKQIDQDAVLLVACKRCEPEGTFVRRVASLRALSSNPRAVDLNAEDEISINLKGFLLSSNVLERVRALVSASPRISDFCRSGAGIVTAANDYFILTNGDVREQELDRWARPILKKSAYLGSGPIFTAEDFDRVRASFPANLIDLNAYDEATPDTAVEAYLERGRKTGIPNSYKARHRPQWYKVPVTWLGEGFFFKRSHAYPRLCVNAVGVHVTDTAYSIAPITPATMRGICFSFYNSATLLMSEIEGRFYGGGVLELTPNEFRRLPLYYDEPSDEEFAAFCNQDVWADPVALALRGDERLVARHGFEKAAVKAFHEAWQTLRSHRLRHGRSA